MLKIQAIGNKKNIIIAKSGTQFNKKPLFFTEKCIFHGLCRRVKKMKLTTFLYIFKNIGNFLVHMQNKAGWVKSSAQKFQMANLIFHKF